MRNDDMFFIHFRRVILWRWIKESEMILPGRNFITTNLSFFAIAFLASWRVLQYDVMMRYDERFPQSGRDFAISR